MIIVQVRYLLLVSVVWLVFVSRNQRIYLQGRFSTVLAAGLDLAIWVSSSFEKVTFLGSILRCKAMSVVVFNREIIDSKILQNVFGNAFIWWCWLLLKVVLMMIGSMGLNLIWVSTMILVQLLLLITFVLKKHWHSWLLWSLDAAVLSLSIYTLSAATTDKQLLGGHQRRVMILRCKIQGGWIRLYIRARHR